MSGDGQGRSDDGPEMSSDGPGRNSSGSDTPCTKPNASRRATITTTHEDDETAERIAAAVRPDNTAEMDTRTNGDRVITTVARETTGGLQSTVDDYVVNASVAAQLTTDTDNTQS